MRCELLIALARLAALVVSLGVLSASRSAWAHGSAPSAIDVLATDDGRTPTFVALSQGLAKRESSGVFSFVCPAAWGSTDAVLASRGDVVAAVTGGRLFVGGRDACALTPIPRDEAMIDVSASGTGLLALGRTASATRIFEVAATAITVRAEASHQGPSACVIDAVVGTSDGRIVGACASPGPALFLPDAEPKVRSLVLPFAISRLVPRVVADETISLLAIATKGSFLVDVDRADSTALPRIAGPFATVLGPVLVDGVRVAVVDGHLWVQRAGTWAEGPPVPYTCLSQVGAAVFACSLGATFRLARQGDAVVEADAVFSLAMLGEPTAACGEASGDAVVCRGEWSHFGAEAGLLGTRPTTTPEGPRLPAESTAQETSRAEPAAEGCAFRSTHAGLLRSSAHAPARAVLVVVLLRVVRRARIGRGLRR